MKQKMSVKEYRRLVGLDPAPDQEPKPKKNKFNTADKPDRTWSGLYEGFEQTIVFDSEKEMKRFIDLKLAARAGQITNLQLQKRFLITPKQKDERASYYYSDFFYCENGQWIVEDVKSDITKKKQTYINKRKEMKRQYPTLIFREFI